MINNKTRTLLPGRTLNTYTVSNQVTPYVGFNRVISRSRTLPRVGKRTVPGGLPFPRVVLHNLVNGLGDRRDCKVHPFRARYEYGWHNLPPSRKLYCPVLYLTRQLLFSQVLTFLKPDSLDFFFSTNIARAEQVRLLTCVNHMPCTFHKDITKDDVESLGDGFPINVPPQTLVENDDGTRCYRHKELPTKNALHAMPSHYLQ